MWIIIQSDISGSGVMLGCQGVQTWHRTTSQQFDMIIWAIGYNNINVYSSLPWLLNLIG